MKPTDTFSFNEIVLNINSPPLHIHSEGLYNTDLLPANLSGSFHYQTTGRNRNDSSYKVCYQFVIKDGFDAQKSLVFINFFKLDTSFPLDRSRRFIRDIIDHAINSGRFGNYP